MVGSIEPDSSLIALEKATKQLPVMRYAWGVVGITTVLAFASQTNIPPGYLVAGGIIVFSAMILLFLFQIAHGLRGQHLERPARVLINFIVYAFIVSCVLLITSAFFNWPLPLKNSMFPPSAFVETTEPEPLPDRPSDTSSNREPTAYTAACQAQAGIPGPRAWILAGTWDGDINDFTGPSAFKEFKPPEGTIVTLTKDVRTRIVGYSDFGTRYADDGPFTLKSRTGREIEFTCRRLKAGTKLFLVKKNKDGPLPQNYYYQVAMSEEDANKPLVRLPPIRRKDFVENSSAQGGSDDNVDIDEVQRAEVVGIDWTTYLKNEMWVIITAATVGAVLLVIVTGLICLARRSSRRPKA